MAHSHPAPTGPDPAPDADDPGAAAPQRPAVRPPGAARRRVGQSLLVLGILVLVTAGWAAWRAYSAYRHLQSAQTAVSALQGEVKDVTAIDTSAAGASVRQLQQEAGAARSATRDPIFRLYYHLPVLGGNLRAEATVADVVDQLASTTAPALLDVAATVSPANLAPHDGRIDVDAISRVAPAVLDADTAVARAQATVAGIDRSDLVGPVQRALTGLTDKLDRLHASTSSAALLARLVPPMLGASGPRTYAIVFQNLAETRATGGLFGSYALIRIDHGQLSIGTHAAVSRTIGEFNPPVAAGATLNPTLYGDQPGVYSTDANLTPDFPTAASLFTTMVGLRTGTTVDGVIALDPVALSYLMAGTAPVDIGHGIRLSAANVVQVLLSQAYALFPDNEAVAARDAFLGQATVTAFSAVTGSSASGSAVLSGVKRAIADRRLLVYSTHAAEQSDLVTSAVGGRLPDADPADAPTVGVFRNDGTGGKLDYYAAGSVAVTAGDCLGSGRRALVVTTTLTSHVPASGLPVYVLGLAKAGQYILRTNVLVFAPTGATISAVTVSGRTVPVTNSAERGRAVAMVTVDLGPGQTKQITARLAVAATGTGIVTPRVLTTPGVTDWPVTAAGYAGCG